MGVLKEMRRKEAGRSAQARGWWGSGGGGRGRLPSWGRMGGRGSAGHLLASFRMQLSPAFPRTLWGTSPELQGPFSLPHSQAGISAVTSTEEPCRALSSWRGQQVLSVSGARPGGYSCSDNVVQPRRPGSLRC